MGIKNRKNILKLYNKPSTITIITLKSRGDKKRDVILCKFFHTLGYIEFFVGPSLDKQTASNLTHE